MNAFFKVDRPFRIFRHIGLSPSNCYVGAGRIIATVMEAINARPGDEIHALAGGTFLMRDGVIAPVSLRAPKHPFEKDYGLRESDAAVMKNHVKRGLAIEIPEPSTAMDYASARERVRANMLRELHNEVIHVEDSPVFTEMRGVVDAAVAEFSDAGATCSVEARDIDAYGGPKFDITIDGQRLTFSSGAPGVFSVEVPETVQVQGVKDPIVIGNRRTHFFRSIDGVADPIGAARDFLLACGRALTAEAPRIGP
jgi:hypothetical protein